MKTKQIPGIPQQIKGGFHNTESQKDFDDPEIALQKFVALKERFYSVNQWQKYCGENYADFRLHDSSGNFVERIPKVGDFIRIDIPGPGASETKGFDWVQIIEISDRYINDDELENLLITYRPSKMPADKKSHHTAHFYSSEATSTFMISRSNTHIKAGIYGRNESPNLNANFFDKIRDLLIAVGGMAGVSKIQWKRLSDGLLDF